MSEIFYTQVDKNLQTELNARAVSGHLRRTEDLNYMLSKIANVAIVAYDSETVNSYGVVHRLGGDLVRRVSSYFPDGNDGFLTGNPKSIDELDWVVKLQKDGETKTALPLFKDILKQNTSNRIAPYISSANITVGDHSMGLLNSATLVIEIPNVDRDLEIIERIYMRPGRKIKMDIEYPPDSIISGLKLEDKTLPSLQRLTELYGDAIIAEKRRTESLNMNRSSFEGLITSFDLQYNSDYSVTLQLQLRGTSNVMADVSAFTNSTVTEDNSNGKKTTNPVTNPDEYASAVTVPSGSGLRSFFDLLFKEAETEFKAVAQTESEQNIISGNGDDWILFGNAWAQKGASPTTDTTTFHRYITLGRLMNFINKNVISKLANTVSFPKIICDSALCFSSYFPELVSVDPINVLLIPANYKKKTTERYGDRIFFETTNFKDFPGFLGNDRAYPARIFLNLKMINDIIDELQKNATKDYKIADFLQEISNKIESATAGAIQLKLISHPRIDTLLAFYDQKYLGQPEDLAVVKPYHIPCHAKLLSGTEESVGTIVHDFKMSAKLPDSAATLSYVLNQQPDEVSEQDIAPYVNTMYQFGDPDKLQAAQQKYSLTHFKYLQELRTQKIEFGKNVSDTTVRDKLKEAMVKHLQYPYPELKDSVQAVAPIFPWDVSFTIDGINGFRYGDVLTFDILPNRYKANTVFSIIKITHDLAQDGQWKTSIQCIMRPKLDK